MGEPRPRRPLDPTVAFARGLAVLSLGYAVWALAILPGQYFRIGENLQYRQVFYENIAIVPILAVFGAAALLTIDQTAGLGADPSTWRGWLAARGQLLVAAFVALAQLWFVNRAACPFCDPFPAHLYALMVIGIVAVQAGMRSRPSARP